MENPNILTEDQIKQALSDLPGWKFENDKLSKEFAFADFVGSLSFINRLVASFQEMDHHPDIHIFYSKVIFELQRFDVGGKVTDRDVEIAKLIERTYATENKL